MHLVTVADVTVPERFPPPTLPEELQPCTVLPPQQRRLLSSSCRGGGGGGALPPSLPHPGLESSRQFVLLLFAFWSLFDLQRQK